MTHNHELQALIEQTRALGSTVSVVMCPYFQRQGYEVITAIHLTEHQGLSLGVMQPVEAAEKMRELVTTSMPTQPTNQRPYYEALGELGFPSVRLARVIGELKHALSRQALDDALPSVEQALGLKAKEPLHYGWPIYESFGLKRAEATANPQADLLITSGANLSLDFVPRYQVTSTCAESAHK